MKVLSTEDVPIEVLRELVAELKPEIGAEVDPSQTIYRSFDPPSWVKFLAQCDWWVQLLAASAALSATEFVKEIGKEAGKEVWKNRGIFFGALKSGAEGIKKLTACVMKLRGTLSERTKIVIGIPVPSERWPSTIELVGATPEDLEFEIMLFAMHQPALSALIRDEELDDKRVLASLEFKYSDDGSLAVSWTDAVTNERITRVLPTISPKDDASV